MKVEVCFSARTDQIPYIEKIVVSLAKKGVCGFYQKDIKHIGENWKAQWFKAADAAKKIVCVLTKDYPESIPCVKVCF